MATPALRFFGLIEDQRQTPDVLPGGLGSGAFPSLIQNIPQNLAHRIMKEIFNVLCQSRNIENEINLRPELVEGYTEEELMKMERLYDVTFSGDLRDFMLEMGRSDGGLLGDDPISLYSRLSVRRHIFSKQGWMIDFWL